MSAPLLDIVGLSAVSDRDGGAPVLSDVSLRLERGRVRGLVGESGAGKSTIAKALLGILPRTVRVVGGHVLFEGRDLLAMAAAERRRVLGTEIVLIPQDPMTSLNPSRRIGAQIVDGLVVGRGLGRREATARAAAMLAEVQIRDPERVMRSYPHELSGGMRQRVLIAAAFVMEPKLVVADEPTTALDVTVQKQILRLIRGLQEAHGTAVVFVTHDLGVVAKICDDVTLLWTGRVVEAGPVEAMLTRPTHPYTRALIAASPRHDRPEEGLAPVPEAVFAGLRREAAALDGEPRHGR
ncbi:ABC transporter ATP-binding protein [Oharaeibacter diazotrophicus]|uniref:Peptide/nickel transport system ATP-binding protein n=1 Tax=Oharaeibacter diazotrophicus TaxID=1920512 RepID=A0A4R6RM72_9HYPH|nr:ABC transporter ATP-binding protein [Oharaeibacter diazotrophicus]TDP87773.1 peptide/nickel transport system ATP-binding protein [Oharaeibacter diazotrophicus]BBE74645.1 putative D,D-dipeptide transport ATP-binding protein DdpD [Pleomorphomonas sp. SM30]GLS77021.1 ABC transporter ATP-binding protein [Oharaeibacter diazotrophicus]